MSLVLALGLTIGVLCPLVYYYRCKKSVVFESFRNKNLILVSYMRHGKKYNLFLPFHDDLVSPMQNITVEAHLANGKKIDITQEPGVPYFISPSMLKATHVSVKDYNGKQITVFQDNEIPFSV